MTEDFLTSVHEGVGRITLARPSDGNTIGLAMLRGLNAAFDALSADSQVRVIVLDAQGSDFCRGRDNRGENRQGLSTYGLHQGFMQPILDLYAVIERCPVPTICVVQGPALGFGCALAGVCDITLAAKSATFALPEILHGIPPTLALSALRSRVGLKALAWLVHSGASIDATTAQVFGLVSKVSEDGTLASEAASLISAMATRPRLVNATIKEFSMLGGGTDRALASRYAGLLMAVNRSQPTA